MEQLIDIEQVFDYIRRRMKKPFFGKFILSLSVHNSQVKSVKSTSTDLQGLEVEETIDSSQFESNHCGIEIRK